MFACKRHIALFILSILVFGSVSALADDAELSGSIVAYEAAPGARGVWHYDMRITWRNHVPAGLTNLNLKLDDGGNCSDEDILAYVMWDTPAGVAHFFDVNAAVYFDAELLMQGDPTLQIQEPIIRFAPNADSEVRPGPNGTAVFTFWSNLPPWPIDQPNDLLSEIFGLDYTFGRIEGVFPALPCDPIATEAASWGAVKARYGR